MNRILTCGLAALALSASAPALARPITAMDLVTLRRLGEPAVSPDGRWAVYQLRETDLDANKGRNGLWLLDLSKRGAQPVRIAATENASDTSPVFSPDGQEIWFLSDRSGTNEIWRVPVTGGAAASVTEKLDLSGFKIAPTGDKVAVWADRKPGAPSLESPMVKKDPNAGSGRVYEGLFVRHWDTWSNGDRSQLFVLPVTGGKAPGYGVSVSKDRIGDVPSKPFGDGTEIAWSADGRTLYFTLREAGRIESLSTNLDIFAVAADGSGQPENLTDANDATDTLPTVSPDGKWLAYVAMKRPGYEADRQVVQLRNLATGQTRALTEGWDRSVGSIAWAKDGRSLLVTAEDIYDRPVFRVDVPSGKVTRLTKDGSTANISPLAGGGAILTLDSLTAPADLYRMDKAGKLTRLTQVNADKLAGVDMPEPTRFSFTGANGDTVWGYAVKPAGVTDATPAPVAFMVHGGPQGTVGNGWSYRWNPAVISGSGFATVFVDFHGSTGYGQAFTDAINRNWGGWPLEDLQKGLAAAGARFKWADTKNACALGGSYGGYMMNWIAGNWPGGFRCLVTHAGVFDARAMAYETEELWFDEWEHGGPYYEQSAEYEKWNPVRFADKWQTPMLVIHGEKDFRIPYTQGLAAFTALQRRDVPSKLVVFPDENHWILKPKNSLQWYREVLGWMHQWTDEAPSK
ncbi:prolyl oligopeptidase family serine peptidase [Sphingomonas sp. ID0503]|uniref:S9 family peptidase n=1 Tax=Sphingomonas sp. ID0503 TaxID=3399691 RepID=UPI003AFAF46A